MRPTMNDLPSFAEPIGLFALPSTVLLPGASLSLHIYEPRYRDLIHDAIAENAVIGMALIQKGYKPHDLANSSEIHPVVCVTRIREHAELTDSALFVNLFGLCRARILRENQQGDYSTAMLDPLTSSTSGIEADGEHEARRSLRKIINSPAFDMITGIERYRILMESLTPLIRTVDIIAATLLPSRSLAIRQYLLEETDVLQRAKTLAGELRAVMQALQLKHNDRDSWPHLGSIN